MPQLPTTQQSSLSGQVTPLKLATWFRAAVGPRITAHAVPVNCSERPWAPPPADRDTPTAQQLDSLMHATAWRELPVLKSGTALWTMVQPLPVSCSMSGALVAPAVSPPTAQQSDAAVQVTPLSVAAPAPVSGEVTTDHDVPSKRSTKVC